MSDPAVSDTTEPTAPERYVLDRRGANDPRVNSAELLVGILALALVVLAVVLM